MPPTGTDRKPGGPPRLVCRCIGVSSPRILEAVLSGGLSRLEEVQTALKAGTGCGTCHPEIEEILADLRGEPVDRMRRMENAMICRQETHQRIEASLFSGIVPKLPPETVVELLGVDGLRVHLHLAPNDAALRELIAAKLKKFICADLEIRFS